MVCTWVYFQSMSFILSVFKYQCAGIYIPVIVIVIVHIFIHQLFEMGINSCLLANLITLFNEYVHIIFNNKNSKLWFVAQSGLV